MIYVGLDISINSPGITIFNEDTQTYKFVCFGIHKDRDNVKYKKGPRLLLDIDDLEVIPMFREFKILSKKDKNDYSKTEMVKLNDAIINSDVLVEAITDNTLDLASPDDVYIGIEGYSYGSKGSSLIDIVTYSTLVRTKICHVYDDSNVHIFTPSEAKMFAGRKIDGKTGNASKYEMFTYFRDNVLNDKNLTESDFWQYINNNEDDLLLGSNNTNVRSPVSDIIDSYFILKKLQFLINEQKSEQDT